MPATIKMIKACPETLFILDHLGKPDIRNKRELDFRQHIDTLAALPNVVAKISGLVTEADWGSWTADEIRPYIDHAVHAFGFERLMFGGDWPVVNLAATYKQWLNAVFMCLTSANERDLSDVLYNNAIKSYNL
jgi:L-fuconolactonase